MALIELVAIQKSFHDGDNRLNHVLRDVNLRVEQGDFVAIKGASGSGKTVTFGIRPEDVYDSEMFIETAKCVFESEIKVYELLGAEVYLYFDLAEYSITARVDSRTTARPGDKVKFAFDVEKIHIFDKETEQVITN